GGAARWRGTGKCESDDWRAMKSTSGEHGNGLANVGLDSKNPLTGRRRSRWNMLTPCWDVLGPGQADPRRALAVVCKWYWYPVYAFIRRLGVPADDARDVTQGFFVGLLERNDLARLDPARGRFRC